ncbi:AMP-binding protein [Nocardioides sp. Bht2]|uniref:AMP-binding protein n=1 Tax=Nocardioides sp. Bht2 TaxID=3392297 RepID=UPI0039B36A9B
MSSPTFAELILARSDDDSTAIIFEGESWSWREAVLEARRRVTLIRPHRNHEAPWHIGIFCENSAEHVFWWLAAALDGATVVGLNPTRRGSDLARDIAFTECQFVVVDGARRNLLNGLLDLPPILEVDAEEYAGKVAATEPAVIDELPAPEVIMSLVFTSGTTSAPKAVICTQRRMGMLAVTQQERRALTSDDTFYIVMPLFHSNAVMAGLAPAVSSGAAVVIRRKFSASNWLPDVREHGVTFFNYVGKPLNYVLATPERPDDADNTLRIAFGNEASERDIARFSERFGCKVIDSFGSSEGEIRIMRTPETPTGSLGRAPEGTVVLDPETLLECPPAVFDERGRLTNGDAAIGEIVNKVGAQLFEGYWNNPEADADRLRNGWVWSGDLAYRDADGFFYFAGRNGDWLRVDGENLAAAPIERLLLRYSGFSGVAVVATPDPIVGDAVLAVVELDHPFDPEAFQAFLDTQPDLGTKWSPAHIKVVEELPRTGSNKIIKRAIDRQLRGEIWDATSEGYQLR